MAKRYTQEWKDNIARSRKGQAAWNKGLTKNDERVMRYAIKMKGKKKSALHRKKLSDSMQGRPAWNKGIHWSEEIKEKISNSKKGIRQKNASNEHHYKWKGNKVGYSALHCWLRREYGVPNKCDICKKENVRIEWHNKTKKYKRNRNDWLTLCVSCHKKIEKGKI